MKNIDFLYLFISLPPLIGCMLFLGFLLFKNLDKLIHESDNK